jgi:hypothetical protein
MTRGLGPTCHTGWPEARRRQTATQGAYNCPAVMHPFIFAATSGQEGESPHKERATAPRLCAPTFLPKPAVEKANHRAGSVQSPAVVRYLSFAATSGPTWGPRPTCHATGAPVTRCGRIAPPLAPIHVMRPVCHMLLGHRRRLKR